MNNSIFIYDYIMLLQGALGVVHEHSHNAIQFFISNNPMKFSVNNMEIVSSFLIVNSNTLHSIEYSDGDLITFLIDNESKLSGHISKKILNDSMYRSFDEIEPISNLTNIKDVKLFIENILKSLSIPKNCSCSVKDDRVSKTLIILNKSVEKKISIKELSNEIGLSEGRLMHLFTNEVGIPLRKYLLWLRLKDAIKLICEGKDLTFKAYETGFSDSAHLSRTFKSNFGLNVSTILKNSQFIQFVFLIYC